MLKLVLQKFQKSLPRSIYSFIEMKSLIVDPLCDCGEEEQQVAAKSDEKRGHHERAGKKSVGQVRFVERGRDAFFLPTMISSRAYPCHRLCSSSPPFKDFGRKVGGRVQRTLKARTLSLRRLRGSVWISLSLSLLFFYSLPRQLSL